MRSSAVMLRSMGDFMLLHSAVGGKPQREIDNQSCLLAVIFSYAVRLLLYCNIQQ